MIPDSVFASKTCDRKQSLSRTFRRVDDLIRYCEIEDSDAFSPLENNFPLRVTRHYASLIEKGNPDDPLLRQVLPDAQEYQSIPGYMKDAVGDQKAMPLPGLIHKYQGRVLLTLSGACAIHCRYCFRRHFDYADSHSDISPQGPVMRYLQDHPEINEVILSGGDPLMSSDDKLGQLVDQLNQIPHLRLLRIHSRLLSVLPERITPDLMQRLERFKGQLVFVTHINHAHELSDINRTVFSMMAQRGHKLLNQSVLLKGVNDDATILQALSYKLFDSSISPYYLHRLDKVRGAAHFDLDKKQSCQIYRELEQQLPGYLLPRMVEEIAGRSSKTTVNCN